MTPKAAFLYQAEACRSLGSPFMHRLLTALAPRIARGGPVYDRVNAWPGDATATGAAVALRIAGGLHRLVLGGDTALAAVYPPQSVPDEMLLAVVEDAFARHLDFFDTWLDSPPQTNEVRRSAALIATSALLTERFGLPLGLSELGASAGLNLVFDRFALDLPDRRIGPPDPALVLRPDWTGPPPPQAPIAVAERRGVDLRPVDPGAPEDRLRLLAYLWPDQPDRLENTRRASAAAAACGVAVDRADAADWLEPRLAHPTPGRLHLVYTTIAWQYFPAETAARATASIEAAGARATPDAPLAWLGMEPDGDSPGAGLTLRVWPGGARQTLGRIDFHGRWVRWQPLVDTP